MDLTPAVVAVDGTGTNGLATVRSLGRRGVPVYVLALRGSPEIASASRYCHARVEVPHAGILCTALVDLAGRLEERRPVLFVDNDAMIRMLAPHAEVLRRRFAVVEPLADAPRLTDKAFQLEAAARAGIPVPRTWFPASWAELHEIARESGKRLIAKPSPAKLAPDVEPPFKALIRPSAAALAEELRARGVAPDDIMVQEFIEGDDACIHVALCYRAGDGSAYVFTGRKLRQTQPGAGVMAVGQAVDTPEIRSMTERLVASLGVRGVVCTEFKRDPGDGRYYFIEWNARPAYFHSLGWKAGFDLPWIAYCDHVDPARLPALPLVQSSAHYWINLRGDLQHLACVPRLLLKAGTWVPYFQRKEWAVFSASDPRPWALAMLHFGAALPGALRRRFSDRSARRSSVSLAT